MRERADIEKAIEALEAQRFILGDSVVDEAVGALLDTLSTQQDDYSRTEEQRKLVTILFCDLVGFTALSDTMDPEAIREILNMFFSPWHSVVSRYNGKIEKFIGDAVMAVFGIPHASEVDPEHAIRAALDAREMLIHRNDDLDKKFGIRLGFRIGINTGNVLVGELGREGEFTVTGDSVNLASRIQGAAPKNGILISHDTYRHVRGIFDVEMLPEISVKGKPEPVVVYEIKRVKPRAFRIAARGVEGLETRTIGREKEFGCLEDAWLAVSGHGEARFIIISGEAGIGKSRLLYDFRNWMELRPEQFWLFQGRASGETRNQPYSLIRDLICFRFQISEVDDSETRRLKLEQGVLDFLDEDEHGREIAHFIGQLIGFDFSESTYIRGILHDPGQIRDRAAHAFTRFFTAATTTNPVVIYLEDIQWADQGSLDILNMIGMQVRNQPLLIISTARPELIQRTADLEFFNISTEGSYPGGHVIAVRLEALSEEHTRALLHDILRLVDGVPEQLLKKIVEQSEGNPYYIEEFVKILIDEGVIVKGERKWWVVSSKLKHVEIPPTLTGLLQARLDRLPGAERDVIQKASVVGRVFWDGIVAELCAESSGLDQSGISETIRSHLEALCRRELLLRRDDTTFSGNSEYIFHHTLLHAVTYETVLKKHRGSFHRKIARWILNQHDVDFQLHAGIVAEHFDRAGDVIEASSWYVKAAKFATDRFANEEGLKYVDRSLELIPEEDNVARFDALAIRVDIYDRLGKRDMQSNDIDDLGLIADRLQDEKRIVETNIKRISLGNTTGDYSHATEAAHKAIDVAGRKGYAALEALARQRFGETLWRTGDLKKSHETLSKARSLAASISSLELEAGLLRNLGAVSLYMSRFVEARKYLETSLQLYREMADKAGESATLNNLGLTLYHMGDIKQARTVYEQALQVFRTIGHRHGESSVLINLGMVSNQQEDFGSALRYYGDALSISREINHKSNEILALNNTGFILASLGSYDTAPDYYIQALEMSKSLEEKNAQYVAALNLGHLRLRTSDYEGAVILFESCLKLADELGSKASHIETITYLGHTCLEQGKIEEAERKYRKASDILGSDEISAFTAELIYGFMKIAELSGDVNRSKHLAEELVSRLPTIGLSDSLEPIRLYLGCYEVFRSHDDARARDVLEAAMERLHAAAGTIVDDDMRRSFLDKVAFNRAVITAWQQYAGTD